MQHREVDFGVESQMEMKTQELAAIADYVMPRLEEGRSDLGLLFGTRHGVDEFCAAAYALWQRGMFPKLLVSGGATGGRVQPEAEVITERLQELGMPEEALILEKAATNTGENVIFSRRLAEESFGQDSVQSLLVIGKVCSMRRYLMTLERHWPQPRRFACAVNYFGVERERWHEHEEFRRRVLAEFTKIPEYLEQGFLREVDLDGI
jgi:uncharacterized SAM-binding protein YcdF (DUF218 family)